jgi:hypothetical protein
MVFGQAPPVGMMETSSEGSFSNAKKKSTEKVRNVNALSGEQNIKKKVYI